MTNVNSQKIPTQSEDRVEDPAEEVSDEISAVQEQRSSDVNKPKRALSKREIMEQLSRERFPWDE
ncbi:hypothetical protein [Polynucleobacter sp. MWH-UH25E]|uniref:hypothetical protein n=1 Tax=Polynucleobacter sp. MWH-UH25E TaxID=1855616 RepID=UPI001BFE55F7|nr:hypothetical protein [Polynucleobacter sp. MWH-UH25E]QWD62571.1 hypothetical protein ICV39_02850 [Polynucleobacter sp. MWH-UH25E]